MPPSKKGTSKSPALSVLRMVTKMISTLTYEELEALASGKARLTITRSWDDKNGSLSDRPKAATIDLDRLKGELSTAESTDAGFSILNEARPTRADLERMARSLDLPVLKQDSVRRLEEKIIEALIGSRLNSRAVRGR